jgi:hypothetical protein
LSKVVERIPKAMENVARNGWKNGGDRLDARKITFVYLDRAWWRLYRDWNQGRSELPFGDRRYVCWPVQFLGGPEQAFHLQS